MNSKKIKKRTIGLIDVMIQHADKGPSGFWTDDFEGCGNPKIFPEFEEGLKHGKYVRKEHYLCPWNTAILYGEGHGNIETGCYHSCSIRDAMYLSTDIIISVLIRFKKRLNLGNYDNTEHIKPLLMEDEHLYIEKQKIIERYNQKFQLQEDREFKTIKAAGIIEKYKDNEHIIAFLISNYGDDILALSEYGCIDFSLTGKADVVGGEKLTYDDYLDIQIQSYGKKRLWFELCYYNLPCKFMGCIE